MANNKNRHHRYTPPAQEVQGDKEVLARPIESLNLPEETLALLKNNRFATVLDIAKRTERDMFRVQTFNKKHLVALKSAMNAVGIDFLPYIPRENTAESEGAKTDKPAQNNRPQPPKQQDNARPPRNDNGNRDNGKPAQNGGKSQQNNNRQQQNGKQVNGKPQAAPNKPQQNGKKPQNSRPPEPIKPKVELPREEWLMVSKNGKYGFSNGLTTVIQPQFDEVFCFKDGLACVDVGEKFGYIDQKGEFVITPQYECAMSFSEGMAVFFEGEKCGYINKTGEVVIPAKYDAATAFENGRAKVKEAGKWQTIDPEGNILWSK